MLTNIDKHTHRSWDSDVIMNDGGKLDIVVKESDLETKPVVWLKLGRVIVRPARAWPMLSFANSRPNCKNDSTRGVASCRSSPTHLIAVQCKSQI